MECFPFGLRTVGTSDAAGGSACPKLSPNFSSVALGRVPMFGDKLEHGLKVVGAVAALGGLLLAGAQFTRNQSVEAVKPYLRGRRRFGQDATILAALLGRHGIGREPADD